MSNIILLNQEGLHKAKNLLALKFLSKIGFEPANPDMDVSQSDNPRAVSAWDLAQVAETLLIENLAVDVEWNYIDKLPTEDGNYWVILNCDTLLLSYFCSVKKRFLVSDHVFYWTTVIIPRKPK